VVDSCFEGRHGISKTGFKLAGLGLGRAFGMLALRERLVKGNCASDVCEAVRVSKTSFRFIWGMGEKMMVLGLEVTVHTRVFITCFGW
jgi:hypothetical protein